MKYLTELHDVLVVRDTWECHVLKSEYVVSVVAPTLFYVSSKSVDGPPGLVEFTEAKQVISAIALLNTKGKRQLAA